MNSTFIGIIFCLCAAVVIYSVSAAYRLGKRGADVKQFVGNVSNSNVNQCGTDVGDECSVLTTRYILSVDNLVMDDTEKENWLSGLKMELAKQIGIECFARGYIEFEIRKHGYVSKTGTIYDILAGKLIVKQETNH